MVMWAKERVPKMLERMWARRSKLSRDRRWRLFMKLMTPFGSDLILDVGPGMGEMLECRYPWLKMIVGVDRQRSWSMGPVLKDYPDIRFVQADGCRLPFQDGAFDIVFSNAVIEHVKNQEGFAREIRRTGRSYFVATPNRWFPLETHSKLPFVHYLPHNIAWKIVASLSRYKAETWLLSPRKLRRLFPDATLAYSGPSIIAYRRKEAERAGSGPGGIQRGRNTRRDNQRRTSAISSFPSSPMRQARMK